MKRTFANLLLTVLFYPAPKIEISKEEEKKFNELYEVAMKRPGKLIEYNLPVPKYKFLYYLAMKKPIVFHGSNHQAIDSFEPREQTLFDGQMASAIFATKDPIWSIFYAVFDKNKLAGTIRNASLSTGGKKSFHFYSLTQCTTSNHPWTSGMVYLLPEESFIYQGRGAIQFNEWISERPVSYLAKLKVHPDDFYFLNKVATHPRKESVIKSWLLYKLRTLVK